MYSHNIQHQKGMSFETIHITYKLENLAVLAILAIERNTYNFAIIFIRSFL